MNILVLPTWSSISEINGRVYRFFTVARLSARLSTQTLNAPSFFFAQRVGAAARYDDRCKHSLARLASMLACNILKSNSDRL
jgi:hypothetical protein